MAGILNHEIDVGSHWVLLLYLWHGAVDEAVTEALEEYDTAPDADFIAEHGLVPEDMDGASAELLIGSETRQSTALIRLTSASGEGITMDATTGRVQAALTPEQTRSLSPYRTVHYLLRITWSGGSVERLCEGTLRINPEPAFAAAS